MVTAFQFASSSKHGAFNQISYRAKIYISLLLIFFDLNHEPSVLVTIYFRILSYIKLLESLYDEEWAEEFGAWLQQYMINHSELEPYIPLITHHEMQPQHS